MSSTFFQTRRAVQDSARQWLLGGAAVALGAVVALTAVGQPRPATPVQPIAPAAVAVQPIEGYAVEGAQGYEWRVKSAADGYAVVEGPFGYEVIGRGAAAVPAVGDLVPVRLGPSAALTFVTAADGYHDEGAQGYEWRPRRLH